MKIKKSVRVTAIIIVVLGMIISCQTEETQELLSSKQELVDYKGLKVNHGIKDSRALTFSLEDYQNEYLSNFSKVNGRTYATLENVEYPSLEELAFIEEEEILKYPDVRRMDDSDIEIIHKDFPELTDEEISLNIDLIEEYYESNLTFDVFDRIVYSSENSSQDISNGRVSYYGGLCSEEFWYLFGRVTAATAVKKATDKTWEFVDAVYGERTGKTRSDAFRHAIWNALIAKYYADNKKDIGKGIDLAKGFTNRHEECNASDGSPAYDQEMDYHNNLVGRDYFESVGIIKSKKRRFWFRKKWLEAPSDESMRDAIKSKANIAIKVAEDINSVKNVSRSRLVFFK